MLPDALGATWRRQCDAFQRVVGNAGDVILSGSAASRGGGSPRPALPLAARRPMAGTNDILNNVRDFVSLRAAMPHSPILTNTCGLAFRRPAPIFRAMSSLPRAYLSPKLTQPLPTKGGTVLRTVGEAANYVLARALQSLGDMPPSSCSARLTLQR
jgi:hypothetical protein